MTSVETRVRRLFGRSFAPVIPAEPEMVPEFDQNGSSFADVAWSDLRRPGGEVPTRTANLLNLTVAED